MKYTATTLVLSLLLLANSQSMAQTKHDVVIDVGHSLRSSGATSANGLSEFSFNKRFAEALQLSLGQKRVASRVQGADGSLDDLWMRVQKAEDASLLVSIHHDSIQPGFMNRAREFSGFSIFVSDKNAAFSQSLACAKVVGGEMISSGFKPSLYHAEPIKGENRPFLSKENGVHNFTDLLVVKYAKQPAMLIEVGVIVNPDDEKTLADPASIQKQANAIATGIAKCFGVAER